MKHVFFKPWIGRLYEESLFGKRILILGESHYIWDDKIKLDRSFTSECIVDQIEGVYTKQFWTNIVIAFIGTNPSLEEKEKFWNSVSFYNYIQEPVGMGPRVSPNREMWANSVPAFIEVLNELKPQFILTLGYRLWWHLPSLNREEGPIIDDNKKLQTWFYSIKNEACLAYGIRHPSAGFSGKYWHRYIHAALNVV